MKSEPRQELPSRRNRVTRTLDRVVKVFSALDDFSTEKEVYARIQDSGLAPELLEASGGRIVTRFLSGSTLFDALEEALEDPRTQSALFDLFFDWCRRFYDRTGLILGDTSFRNFILSDKRLYGVDFETCRSGAPAEDLVWQAAMLATLNPAFTPERVACARRLLAGAPEDLYGPAQDILKQLPDALAALCRRREVPLQQSALHSMGSGLEVACCVLAGGRSSRMGQDKRSLPHLGSTFLDTALDLAALYSDRYLSLAVNDPWDTFDDFKTLRDRFEAKGPLGGIAEALRHTRQPWLLVIPCDMPLLPGVLLDELASHRSAHIDAVMFSEGGLPRTFPLLLRTQTAAPAFETALGEDRLKLRRILSEQLRTATIAAEGCPGYRKGCLDNINTQEEYERLLAQTE